MNGKSEEEGSDGQTWGNWRVRGGDGIGSGGGGKHILLTALHLEDADQDTECGGQLHPDSVSGLLIDCGVDSLLEVLVWGQGFCHTAHHYRHDGKGACEDRSGMV